MPLPGQPGFDPDQAISMLLKGPCRECHVSGYGKNNSTQCPPIQAIRDGNLDPCSLIPEGNETRYPACLPALYCNILGCKLFNYKLMQCGAEPALNEAKSPTASLTSRAIAGGMIRKIPDLCPFGNDCLKAQLAHGNR